MNIHQLALLLGVFVVPLVALAIGHRLARRGPLARNVFWGLVAGHTVAALAAATVAMTEPAFWVAADFWRGVIGYWSMLLLPLVGAALGALRTRTA
ncbi:MAG TPA: hypothetical protein VGE02_03405 [Gemmatimonadales bacterium]